MAEEMTERGRMIRSAGKGIWEKQTPKALPSRRKRGEKQVSSEGLYPRPLVVSLSHASFLNCQSRERAREIGRGKEGGRREINRRRERVLSHRDPLLGSVSTYLYQQQLNEYE
jgi:hypothetical protein